MFDHSFAFDPTYGYDEAALRQIVAPPGPADFAAFWRKSYDTVRSLPLNEEETVSPQQHPNFATSIVHYDTLNGRRAGAWLVIPKKHDPETVVIVGHGYGGRETPDWTSGWLPRAPRLFPCAPGFHLSAVPDLPQNCAAEHVVHGIASRETYLIRDCVAALWSAASLIEMRFPTVRRLLYSGGSFGGGLGALMLPWDKRFERAHLSVPTFGHHPIRLQFPCCGSGEAVRGYYARHPEAAEVLAYYDAATAAAQCGIPVLTTPALFDPAVPPPGQFAVANGFSHPDSLIAVRQAGHFDYAGAFADERRMLATLKTFMA